VNNIIIRCLSAVSALALTAGTAFAQDLTAGKTPAQVFTADCSACHRSPHGLGKKYSTGSLTGFLRTHYTTTQETAGSLAKYIMASRPVATASPTAQDETWREPTEMVEELSRTLRGWANYFEAGTRLPDGTNGGEKPRAKPSGTAAAPSARATTAEEGMKPAGKSNARAAAAAAAPQPAAAPAGAKPAVDSAALLYTYARSGAAAEETVADAPKRQGNLREALKSFRDGLAVADRLAKSDPGNALWQRDLSVSYEKIGDALADQGNLAEALKSYHDALSIRDRLAKADPGNLNWQRDLSVSFNKIGEVLVAQGNLAEALKSFRDGLAIADRLAKSDPGNALWQHDLSVSFNKIGDALMDHGKLASGKSHRRADGEAGLTLPPAETGEPAAAESAPIAPEAVASDDMP
jgi:Tetratricopeptide repeat